MEKEGAPMTSAQQDATFRVGGDFMQQMRQIMTAEMGRLW